MSHEFNDNTWYQLTEGRVGPGSGMSYCTSSETRGPCFGPMNTSDPNYLWQLVPSNDDDTYYLRTPGKGPLQALRVFETTWQNESESQTQYRNVSARNDAQQWAFSRWAGDKSWKINNVAMGTNYNLDVHVGTPLFMSNITREYPPQPAQHWQVLSVRPINDQQWSTSLATATRQPNAASGAASTSSHSSQADHSSISAGAIAGIVIGVVVFFAFVITLLLLYLRRRRANKSSRTAATATDAPSWDGYGPDAGPRYAEADGTSAAASGGDGAKGDYGAYGDVREKMAQVHELEGQQPATEELDGHSVVGAERGVGDVATVRHGEV